MAENDENLKVRNYAYVPVSSTDKNEERQLIAMRALGIEDCCIFLDKQSGKDFNRPGYSSSWLSQ